MQQSPTSALPARRSPTRESDPRGAGRRQEGVPDIPEVALRPPLVREGEETVTGTRGATAVQANGGDGRRVP